MVKDYKFLLVGAAAAAALLAVVVLVKKKGLAADAGVAVGSAAVDLADGVATGVVTSIGEEVGIPKTNMTECEKAIAEGRTWDASFACPAGTFIGSLFGN